jgi:hypothetical protein
LVELPPPPEGKWLAQQWLKVKRFGNDEIARLYVEASTEIGQMCFYLYTRESFLYKLINCVLREPYMRTDAQLKTLGPFCYLLYRYLLMNPAHSLGKNELCSPTLR